MLTITGLSCTCNKNSLEKYEYDNILQQPICDDRCANTTSCSKIPSENFCPYKYFNFSDYNLKTKGIQIYRKLSTTNTSSCDCNAKQNTIYRNEFCIPNSLLKDYQTYTNFHMIPTVFEDNKFLSFFCQILKNSTACNHLANLCVLTFYNLEKNSPCNLFYFTTQIDDLAGNDNDQYLKVRPYLFYKKGKPAIENIEKIIYNEFDLGAEMNFTQISYELHGDLESYDFIEWNNFNLCTKYTSNGSGKIKFGMNSHDKCKISVRKLLHKYNKAMEFYDLYFNYVENGIRYLKGIPILIRNIFLHEQEEDAENWQLVKRFFIIDTLTNPNLNYKPKQHELYADNEQLKKFTSIKVLKSFTLEMKINKDGNKLGTPLLFLEYNEINLNETFNYEKDENGDVVVDFEFKITFKKDHNFNGVLEILLPILIFLGFIGAIVHSIAYKIRQNKETYDFEIFSKFFIQLCSNTATSLFIVAIILTISVFVIYKTQKTVTILLPIRENNLIEAFICIAVLLKSLRLIEVIYQISNIDIFFIDWERPKMYENNHLNIARSNMDTPSMCSSVKPGVSFESVSAWRNYFIANEWQELTTHRKISISIQTILVTLTVLGFENWTTPNFDHLFRRTPFNPPSLPSDDCLNIAVGFLIYFTIYGVQRVYKFLIHERFIENSIQQFIDVCSIANVSVFILFLKSYGFYIHGRSPHGFSDTDMCSMMIQFKREENNMCGHRGLMTGSEQQTYSLLVPANLRSFYDRLITSLQKPGSSIGPQTHYEQFASNKSYEANFEKTILAYHNINRFFGAFIDHALKDLDYIIKERTILESIFSCEIEGNITESKGTFYIDGGHSFDKSLFYGNENILFQFEIMLFCFLVLYTSGNYVCSMIVVSIFYKVIEIIVKFTTKNNLARKTLIDKRFLI